MKAKISTILVSATMAIFLSTGAHAAESSKKSHREANRSIAHARELLGSLYSKSAAREIEHVPDLEKHVQLWVNRSLPAKWKKDSHLISKAIVNESRRYGFDPVFLVSVIAAESSFVPDRVGGVGEIGLMQLRPSTAEWIAKKEKISWLGKRSLFDPVKNIQLGAAYLASLRETFDQHSRLYLAAYNMGPTNVENALDKNVWPRDYPIRVMKHYIAYYRELRKEHA